MDILLQTAQCHSQAIDLEGWHLQTRSLLLIHTPPSPARVFLARVLISPPLTRPPTGERPATCPRSFSGHVSKIQREEAARVHAGRSSRPRPILTRPTRSLTLL